MVGMRRMKKQWSKQQLWAMAGPPSLALSLLPLHRLVLLLLWLLFLLFLLLLCYLLLPWLLFLLLLRHLLLWLGFCLLLFYPLLVCLRRRFNFLFFLLLGSTFRLLLLLGFLSLLLTFHLGRF